MTDQKVSRFKAKFGYVDNDLFEVRYNKVKAALTETRKAWEYLCKSAPPGVSSPFEAPLLRLARAMADAKQSVDQDGSKNAVRKKAYEDLEAVKEESRKLAKEIGLVAKKTPAKCTLDDGTSADIYPPDIPGFFNMSTEERDKVVQDLSKKISEGKKKVNEIISGQYSGFPPPDRKAVADIMWFLKTTAEMKSGEPYERGALTLPDPGNNLRKFFDRVGEVYTRDSSHLKDQQKKSGGQARGIDFYEGVTHEGKIAEVDNLLPSGMRTVLLQQVESPKGESRLYVKMETESARWNPFHKKQEGAPEDRPLQKGDRKNAILHLGNLLKSMLGVSQGDDQTLRNFREKVSSSIKSAWKKVEESAKDVPEAKKKIKAAKFVNEMSEAILAVYGLDIEDEDFWESFEKAAAAWNETVLQGLPTQSAQDIEELFNRFGGEVVLGTDDLATPPVSPTAPNNFQFFKQGGDSLCAYYALCHFQNRNIGEQQFLERARQYYANQLRMSPERALALANEGNDPALLAGAFGLRVVGVASTDVHILADVGAGHFFTVRKVNGSWWGYDSLKSRPVFIGDDDAVKGVASGKVVYG